MRTKAAVIHTYGKPVDIVELDLDGPRKREVLVRYARAGLGHSDLHGQLGDLPVAIPVVGGHEGAGGSFLPACGT